jgi:DNA repair exonuclease SbcCD ATPase subunit
MKILRAKIENFGCFKGIQNIEFDADGKITVIYGLSGSGKSTLLKFINWTFYNYYQTKYADKPFYNENLDLDLPEGSIFNVEGRIEFNHLNTEFEIIRKNVFKRKKDFSEKINESVILMYKSENNSWIEYKDDVSSKINEIVPRALSKYFFFHGETDPGLDKGNSELSDSIYSMFNIDIYKNSLKHLGSNKENQTLIYKYNKSRQDSKSKTVKEKADDLFNKSKSFYLAYNKSEKLLATLKNQEVEINKEIKELIVKIGKLSNTDFEDQIKINTTNISASEQMILTNRNQIGKKIYLHAPYLLLVEKASKVRDLLEKNAKLERTFKGLKRELVDDIVDQGWCVCGRKLDKESSGKLMNILETMPPNSYRYTYNSFVKDLRKKLDKSKEEFNTVDLNISEILGYVNNIHSLNEQKKKLLKQRSESEKLAGDINLLKVKESNLNKNQSNQREAYSDLTTYKRSYMHYEAEYKKALAAEKTYGIFDLQLEYLEEIREYIKSLLDAKIQLTKKQLEKSVKEVYLTLSTRTDIDDDTKFLNDDFTLRETTKSGGQEVIDIYSYVIGMIRALHTNNDLSDREFPVIIDAPFSKTDHIQIGNVIAALPSVATQIAFFTFDLIRIKAEPKNLKNIGKVWLIESNDDHTISTIKRGAI